MLTIGWQQGYENEWNSGMSPLAAALVLTLTEPAVWPTELVCQLNLV